MVWGNLHREVTSYNGSGKNDNYFSFNENRFLWLREMSFTQLLLKIFVTVSSFC